MHVGPSLDGAMTAVAAAPPGEHRATRRDDPDTMIQGPGRSRSDVAGYPRNVSMPVAEHAVNVKNSDLRLDQGRIRPHCFSAEEPTSAARLASDQRWSAIGLLVPFQIRPCLTAQRQSDAPSRALPRSP